MNKLQNAKNLESYSKLYETMEHDHEYPNINLVRLEKWFLKEPGYTLDYGCGYGENLIFLTKRGYNVHGVDINNELINWVRIKCKLKQVPPFLYSLSLLGEEDYNLPYEDNQFDHVISLGVLSYLGDKATASHCVNELTRVLKPDGKMIISTLHPENYFSTNGKEIGDEQILFKGKEMDKDPDLEYSLYMPASDESFSSLFPETCEVNEIGSWDNVYCGVTGKHYCALITKRR